MKVVIIGASGTIGSYLVSYFSKAHEIVSVGRNSGDFKADIGDANSLVDLFESVKDIDSVINCAGEAKWAPCDELSENDFYIGIRSKLMGQVNLVQLGAKYLRLGAAITLTTGILCDDPVKQTASAAMVNGAVNSFVMAAALDYQDRVRINVVAPGLVQDAADKYADYFPGHVPISMERMAKAYERSVLGARTGEVIRVY